MKKKLNAISADNNRLKNNLNSSDGKERQQRKMLDGMNQQMVECEEKLRLANKEKVIIIILNWFINSLFNTIIMMMMMNIVCTLYKEFIRFDRSMLSYNINLIYKFFLSYFFVRQQFLSRICKQSWKQRNKYAPQKSVPFKLPPMNSPTIVRPSSSMSERLSK